MRLTATSPASDRRRPRSDRRASPPLGDRAPLASDPSTTEDSRRTTGRASSAGPSLVPLVEAVVLEGANAINARRNRARPAATDSRDASIDFCDQSTIENRAHAHYSVDNRLASRVAFVAGRIVWIRHV